VRQPLFCKQPVNFFFICILFPISETAFFRPFYLSVHFKIILWITQHKCELLTHLFSNNLLRGGTKRMKKKLLSVVLSVAMVASLLVGCGSTSTEESAAETTEEAVEETTEEPAEEVVEDTNEVTEAATLEAPSTDGWDESKKIYVYLWDADGEGKVQEVIDHMDGYEDYIEIVNINAGGQSEDYQNAVNNALDGGDKYPSIILADEGIAKLWTETDQTAVLSDIGITDAMYANAYSYTVDYATYDGQLKALTWQATPGAFVYRADIAEEVLGTSEPDEVQEYVKDWDSFFDTAEKMKEAGYKMVSGTDDIKYPTLNQRTNPWISISDDGTETLALDETVETYMERAKTLYENGYTNQTKQWSAEWGGNMAEGDVFGYFGCTWFIGSMEGNCPEDSANFGQWRTTNGPESYYWGGTYVSVGADTPNPELAAYFLYEMCCDPDVMYDIAKDKGDFVNNKEAVANLIADGVGARDILGGQNPFETFADAALSINTQSTYLDGTLMGYMDDASTSYNTGLFSSVDECIQYVKDQTATAYDYVVVE
jgi:ABC-type glycerol-3-phosphate transport system substrate-binding protein